MPAKVSPEAILSFAFERAKDAWSKNEQPYFLARLGPDLAREGINYKGILGEQRLADFVRSGHKYVKVVSHPTQRSKIGLIPPDKDFEFAVEPVSPESKFASGPSPIDRGRGSRRRYIVSNFLQLLSELNDADAAQVQIPTNILTKLMRE